MVLRACPEPRRFACVRGGKTESNSVKKTALVGASVFAVSSYPILVALMRL